MENTQLTASQLIPFIGVLCKDRVTRRIMEGGGRMKRIEPNEWENLEFPEPIYEELGSEMILIGVFFRIMPEPQDGYDVELIDVEVETFCFCKRNYLRSSAITFYRKQEE